MGAPWLPQLWTFSSCEQRSRNLHCSDLASREPAITAASLLWSQGCGTALHCLAQLQCWAPPALSRASLLSPAAFGFEGWGMFCKAALPLPGNASFLAVMNPCLVKGRERGREDAELLGRPWTLHTFLISLAQGKAKTPMLLGGKPNPTSPSM